MGVTLKKAAKVLPIISDLGFPTLGDRQAIPSLGDMEIDKPQAVHCELLIDQCPAGLLSIAQAELNYDFPLLGITGVSMRNSITVAFTNNSNQVKQINAQVTDFIKKAKW